MRDIVTETGTFFTGLTDLPILKTTQTSVGTDLANFDGAMVYIFADQWTDGTFTSVIQESNDNGVLDAYAAVATTDLVAWKATSATSATPTKVGNAQPTAISSAATAINQRVGYIGAKRWIRLVSTITGGPVTGMGYDAVILAGRPRNMPSNV